MSRPSKLILAAAKMAVGEAGLDRSLLETGTTASVIATAFGTASFAEELVRAIGVDPQTASPFHFSESVANAPAAQVAIQLGARGTNVAITQREAGPWLALAAAAREVRNGRSQFALAGGVDEINPLVSAVLEHFRAVAPIEPDGSVANLPFAPQRRGFLPAEGAICLVVESSNSATARDAPILAEVLATGRAFDPSAPAWGWGSGVDAIADAIVESLDRAGLALGDLEAWSASASGSRSGDDLEAAILERLFPTARPAIFTPKRIVGEYAGLALGAAVLHTQRSSGPLLSLSLATGGAAAWVVMGPNAGVLRM
jgi:3-oxoacyl-(acyl-carrier-protein) synthase